MSARQGTCDTYNPTSPNSGLCDLTLQNAPAQPSLQNFRNFHSKTDLFNTTPQTFLSIPNKDVSLFVQGHYDLFDNVTFTANAAYVRGDPTQQQPSNAIALASAFTAAGVPINIATTNPYNPFGVKLATSASEPCIAAGTCLGLILTRRALEEGPTRASYYRDNFHIFAGFSGYINLFNREIDWDAGFAQNRLQSVTLDSGAFNRARFLQALGPASQCTSP